MSRALLRSCLGLIVLTPALGLQALGEVRTSTLDSAIPHSHLSLIQGTAISTNKILDPPSTDEIGITVSTRGGMLGIKVIPNLELGACVLINTVDLELNNTGNLAGELSAKVLCWQEGPHYLSVKPTFIISQGKTTNTNATENCQARGFNLPVLYSLDTWRNLSVNASAGVNCEWAKVLVDYTDPVDNDYEIGPVPLLHGQVNINVEATYGMFYLIPEVGICVADGKDLGVKAVFSYGFTIGMKW